MKRKRGLEEGLRRWKLTRRIGRGKGKMQALLTSGRKKGGLRRKGQGQDQQVDYTEFSLTTAGADPKV